MKMFATAALVNYVLAVKEDGFVTVLHTGRRSEQALYSPVSWLLSCLDAAIGQKHTIKGGKYCTGSATDLLPGCTGLEGACACITMHFVGTPMTLPTSNCSATPHPVYRRPLSPTLAPVALLTLQPLC